MQSTMTEVKLTIAHIAQPRTRRDSRCYSIPDHLAKADPLIQQFERWARGH
jgi:hypothetical protein